MSREAAERLNRSMLGLCAEAGIALLLPHLTGKKFAL